MDGKGQLFTLADTSLLDHWGDYGDVLCNGLALSDKREDQFRLGRTGPFVPPISFPLASRSVVVTDSIKNWLEASRLRGIGEFRRVILDKVVFIPWENWDRQKRIPGDRLPFNGEPEEYILHNAHSEEAASDVGVLWTWHPEQVGSVIQSDGSRRLDGLSSSEYEVFRLLDEWWVSVFVDQSGKSTLEDIFGDWVSFKPVEVPWS